MPTIRIFRKDSSSDQSKASPYSAYGAAIKIEMPDQITQSALKN